MCRLYPRLEIPSSRWKRALAASAAAPAKREQINARGSVMAWDSSDIDGGAEDVCKDVTRILKRKVEGHKPKRLVQRRRTEE